MAAESSPALAAFCCDTVEISATLRLISSIPESCSFDAWSISDTRVSTFDEVSATFRNDSPVERARLFPVRIFPMIPMMISSVVRAASEERVARLFTSPATTANPSPAVPARAASTAALSARRLVCVAMVLIVLTTCCACWLAVVISLMARTSSSIEASDVSISCRVAAISLFVCMAFPALFFVIAEIWVAEALISSAAAASCSEPADRLFPVSAICPTSSLNRSAVRLKWPARTPNSSFRVESMRAVKSPSPNRSARELSPLICAVMERTRMLLKTSPMTKAATPRMPTMAMFVLTTSLTERTVFSCSACAAVTPLRPSSLCWATRSRSLVPSTSALSCTSRTWRSLSTVPLLDTRSAPTSLMEEATTWSSIASLARLAPVRRPSSRFSILCASSRFFFTSVAAWLSCGIVLAAKSWPACALML